MLPTAAAAAAARAAGAGPPSATPSAAPLAPPAAAAAAAGAGAESVFVKAAGPRGLGKQFLKVATGTCTDVADVAVRVAAAFPWWHVGADDVALFLVPKDLEQAVQRDAAREAGVLLGANLCLSTDTLAEAGIRNRSCLLARLPDPPETAPGERALGACRLCSCLPSRGAGRGPRDVREIPLGSLRGRSPFSAILAFPSYPFVGGGGGGGGGSNAAAASGNEAVLASIQATLADLVRREARRDLERCFIPPIYNPPSSGSSSSPRREHRVGLKEATIDYYGLWASKEARTVYTMLAGPDDDAGAAHPAAVPFSEAILAHIWPSSKAAEAEALISLLRLPHDFHVLPRNFLVLHKEAEAAFDAEALLLFPARTPTLSAASRLFRTERITGATPAETAAKRARLNGFARRRLFLPLAGEGHVPFMRLLAWKAVSALRAHEEEDEAGLGANPPVDLDMNATTTTRDDGVVVAAVQRLRMAGFRFRTVE